jgi:hypothetical protein
MACTERRSEPVPVEAGSGIELAAGRNVFVAGDVINRVAHAQLFAEPGQGLVLWWVERLALQAFELDPDGVVVAVVATPPAGSACVPGACVRVHELDQHTKKCADTSSPRICPK